MRVCTIFIIAIFIFSCNRDKMLIQEEHVFAGNQWEQGDTIHFEADVSNTELEYVAEVSIIHSSQYEFARLFLSMLITTPDGTTRQTDFDADLKDENGKFTGVLKDGLYTHTSTVLGRTSFSVQGKYQFSIMQFMPVSPVKGIHTLQLKIYPFSE